MTDTPRALYTLPNKLNAGTMRSLVTLLSVLGALSLSFS